MNRPAAPLCTTKSATQSATGLGRCGDVAEFGHKDPKHYPWCANQHQKFDPTQQPGRKWDSAWHALRDAAGLRGLRFHDLRHTVVTRLLEADEPDHVVESITGHISRRMLEHWRSIG